MTLFDSHRLQESVDPIDSRLALAPGWREPAGARARARAWVASQRRSLVLIPLAVASGPHGFGLVREPAVSYLDPLVSLALAALGIYIGFSLRTAWSGQGRWAAAATIEGSVTAMAVMAGTTALWLAWPEAPAATWVFWLLVGSTALASRATSTEPAGLDPSLPGRLGDFDNVMAIALGAVGLTLTHGPAGAEDLWRGVAVAGLAASAAAAGWLLVGDSPSESEQHAFVAGTLLLVGGAAAYLAESALLAGLLAGLTLGALGGPAADRIARDLRYIEHPLLVLLIVVAGMRVQLSREALALGVVMLGCRTAGKLSGGALAARVLRTSRVSHLGLALLSPGVTGTALAMNAVQSAGPAGLPDTLLAATVTGLLASELLSAVAQRGRAGP